jgi:hypothetical protein
LAPAPVGHGAATAPTVGVVLLDPRRHPIDAPDRPALPPALAALGDKAWQIVGLALVELADQRDALNQALAAAERVACTDDLRHHAKLVREGAELLGDHVVELAAGRVEIAPPAVDITVRLQWLVDAVGRLLVRWSPIDDAPLMRWAGASA